MGGLRGDFGRSNDETCAERHRFGCCACDCCLRLGANADHPVPGNRGFSLHSGTRAECDDSSALRPIDAIYYITYDNR